MKHTLFLSSVLATVLTLGASTDARAQTTQTAPAGPDDDFLAPLVPPPPPPPPPAGLDDEYLTPLVEIPSGQDDEFLAPLVDEAKARRDALAKARREEAQKRAAERRWAEEQNRRIDEESRKKLQAKRDKYDRDAARGQAMVRVKHIDPCGTFEVSWGGTKTCHPKEWYTYELVAEGAAGGGDPPPPSEPPPAQQNGQPPPGGDPFKDQSGPSGLPALGGWPTGGVSGGGASGGSPQGGGPGSGPRPGAPGGGAIGRPSNGPVGRPGSPGGGAPAPGGPVSPGGPQSPAERDGFQRLRDFEARLERAVIDAQERADVIIVLRNITRASHLIANGDWSAVATDEDGVGGADIGIWTPTTGAPIPFTTMPSVAPGATTRVRFIIEPEPTAGGLATVSINQTGSPPAVFDIRSAPGAKPTTLPAPPVSNAAFGRLKALEVRTDAVKVAAGTTELFFTVRNTSQTLHYAGGTRLVFSGRTTGGQSIVNRGATYSVRGVRDRATGFAPIQAGATMRLRVVFDGANVRGPFTVTDGVVSTTLPEPSKAAAPEPIW